MDVKNKKTVLNDDAALYHHQDKVSEKEKWQQMSGKKRLEYLKQYYLMKVIVGIAIAAVLVSIVYTMLSPKPEVVFSVAIVNDLLHQTTYQELQEQFEELLELEEKTQETLFDTSYSINLEYSSSLETLQKFLMYNVLGELDVTIMPLSFFEQYAKEGYFSPIAGHLPTDVYMALSGYLLECQQTDEDGNLIPDSETVYGIDISSSWIFEGQERTEPMVLVINQATTKDEMIETFLRFLFFS